MTQLYREVVGDRRRQRDRTLIVVLFLAIVLLLGLMLCLGSPNSEMAPKLFADFAIAIAWLASAQAGKSTFEHLARGKGVQGAWKVLMTSATPDDQEEPTKPPTTTESK